MTARDLATVALRIFGLYLLVQLLVLLPTLLWALPDVRALSWASKSVVVHDTDWGGWGTLALTLWPMLVYGGVGAALLRHAPALSGRLMPDALEKTPTRLLIGQRFQAVAICTVGVLVLANAAPAAMRTMIALGLAAKYSGTPMSWPFTEWLNWRTLTELATSVVVGLWLCLGARGIARGIRFLAGTGARPAAELDPRDPG